MYCGPRKMECKKEPLSPESYFKDFGKIECKKEPISPESFIKDSGEVSWNSTVDPTRVNWKSADTVTAGSSESQNADSSATEAENSDEEEKESVEKTFERLLLPFNLKSGPEKGEKIRSFKSWDWKRKSSKHDTLDKEDARVEKERSFEEKILKGRRGHEEKAFEGSRGHEEKVFEGRHGHKEKVLQGRRCHEEKVFEGRHGHKEKVPEGRRCHEEKVFESRRGHEEKVFEGKQSHEEKGGTWKEASSGGKESDALTRETRKYEIKKVTSANNRKEFAAMVFVGDARFAMRKYMSEFKEIIPLQILSKPNLSLSKIEPYLMKQVNEFNKNTLVVCCLGLQDFLFQEENLDRDIYLQNCDFMKWIDEEFCINKVIKKAKSVRKKILQLFTKRSEVYFTFMSPVDVVQFCKLNGYGEVNNKEKAKAINKKVLERIRAFNNYVWCSIPSKLRENLREFIPKSLDEGLKFTQADTVDGVNLTVEASKNLSMVISQNLMNYASFRGKYNRVVFVGDSRLHNILMAWPGDRHNCTVVMDSHYRMSHVKQGDPLVDELSLYEDSIIVISLGLEDVLHRSQYVCTSCNKDIDLLFPRTFRMKEMQLFTQLSEDAECAANTIQNLNTKSKVMFSLAHPVDVACYLTKQHWSFCTNNSWKKLLPAKVEGICRVLELWNNFVLEYCEKNKLPIWDVISPMYGKPFTKGSSFLQALPSNCFKDGINPIMTVAQQTAKHFYVTTEQLLELRQTTQRHEENNVNVKEVMKDLSKNAQKYLDVDDTNSVSLGVNQYSKNSVNPSAIVDRNKAVKPSATVNNGNKAVKPSATVNNGNKAVKPSATVNNGNQLQNIGMTEHPPPNVSKVFQPYNHSVPPHGLPQSSPFPPPPQTHVFPAPPSLGNPHPFWPGPGQWGPNASPFDPSSCTPQNYPNFGHIPPQPPQSSTQGGNDYRSMDKTSDWHLEWSQRFISDQQSSIQHNFQSHPGNPHQTDAQSSSSNQRNWHPHHASEGSMLSGNSAPHQSTVSRSKSPSFSSKVFKTHSRGLDNIEEKALMALRDLHNKEVTFYRKQPEAYPDYSKEYKIFRSTKVRRSLEAGGVIDEYLLQRDFKNFWSDRLIQLLEESWIQKREQCLSALYQDAKQPPIHSHSYSSDFSSSANKQHELKRKSPSPRTLSRSSSEDSWSGSNHASRKRKHKKNHKRKKSGRKDSKRRETSRSSFEKGRRDLSPAQSRRDLSPVYSRRDLSPMHSRRDWSPMHSRRDLSPVNSRRDLSPMHSRRDLSPMHSRKESFMGQIRRNLSPRQMRDHRKKSFSRDNSRGRDASTSSSEDYRKGDVFKGNLKKRNISRSSIEGSKRSASPSHKKKHVRRRSSSEEFQRRALSPPQMKMHEESKLRDASNFDSEMIRNKNMIDNFPGYQHNNKSASSDGIDVALLEFWESNGSRAKLKVQKPDEHKQVECFGSAKTVEKYSYSPGYENKHVHELLREVAYLRSTLQMGTATEETRKKMLARVQEILEEMKRIEDTQNAGTSTSTKSMATTQRTWKNSNDSLLLKEDKHVTDIQLQIADIMAHNAGIHNSVPENRRRLETASHPLLLDGKQQRDVIEVLEVISRFADDIGNLKVPLRILCDAALRLHSSGMDISSLFWDKDNVTLLNLVSNRLKNVVRASDMSIIQSVIIEEAVERLDKLLGMLLPR